MSEDLPRANVKRIVKAKMLEMAAVRFRERRASRDLPIHRDALMAFSESVKIFIHYLSATANDICRESKRQTLNAEDVLRALEEIEFVELIQPLRSALDGYRKVSESKKVEKKRMRKRKLEESVEEVQEDENGEVDNEENGDDQDEHFNMEEDND